MAHAQFVKITVDGEIYTQDFEITRDPGATGTITVALMAGSEKSLAFGRYPARVGKYDVWSETMAPDVAKAVLESPRLQMGEGTASPDGKTNTSIIDIDNSGLQEAWTQLLTKCSTTPAPAPGLP